MGFNVTIVAGKDPNTSSVSASGSEQHVITDAERDAFGLGDAALKLAVGKYFGAGPNDAFLRSPTPWNDLYATYGWPQVQTVLVVQSATVLDVALQPTVIATNTFRNTSTHTGTFNCGVTQQVANTTQSTWSKTDSITVSQKVSYKIGFLGTGAGGETSLAYQHTWGEGGSESETVTVGSASGVSVSLAPGQAVEAVLSASRGTMHVQLVYSAYLIGDTAVNYNPTFKDHHFWALDIGGVMGAGGIPNARTYTETIEIGYFADSSIDLRDPQTNQTMRSFSSMIRAA
ncbi:MAG TPA: hypothetical protein VFQ85_01120 [Mycobacteriales bacterium]|jgi:hypothetical protein|nr:hypothetical protein [Mycobacteriales bacterium]